MNKEIHLQYFAHFREERGLSKEMIFTTAETPRDLYADLQNRYKFKLSPESLRVAINDEFVEWDTPLRAADTVVFIPPVAGG